jgi:hypothetical protein
VFSSVRLFGGLVRVTKIEVEVAGEGRGDRSAVLGEASTVWADVRELRTFGTVSERPPARDISQRCFRQISKIPGSRFGIWHSLGVKLPFDADLVYASP